MHPLRQLAQLVGLHVPAEYLTLLQNYPAELLAAMRAADGSDLEGTVSAVELIAEPEQVLEINREARSGPVLKPSGEEFFWPQQLIVIGESGTGDYYCIDATGEHDGVLLFEHQPVEFAQVSESLDDFVDLLIENFAPSTNDPAAER
ncbi:MAG: SMI1/KNR4 family protein [Planctomycetaceae bacterium]